MRILLLIIGLLFSLIPIRKSHATGLFDYYIIQYAGEIGFLSAGLGKSFSRYEIAGMYGIVPANISKVDTIQTIALRQTYAFLKKNSLKVYVGINIFHVLGLDNQTGSYRNVPINYYARGSTRVIGNLGIFKNIKKNDGIYFEAGMTDLWIENYINNPKTINPVEYVSLALGYKIYF